MFGAFVFVSTPVTCGQNANVLGSSGRGVREETLKAAGPKEQTWPCLPFFTASQHKQQIKIKNPPSAVSILTFSIFPTTQAGVLCDVCMLCTIIQPWHHVDIHMCFPHLKRVIHTLIIMLLEVTEIVTVLHLYPEWFSPSAEHLPQLRYLESCVEILLTTALRGSAQRSLFLPSHNQSKYFYQPILSSAVVMLGLFFHADYSQCWITHCVQSLVLFSRMTLTF